MPSFNLENLRYLELSFATELEGHDRNTVIIHQKEHLNCFMLIPIGGY